MMQYLQNATAGVSNEYNVSSDLVRVISLPNLLRFKYCDIFRRIVHVSPNRKSVEKIPWVFEGQRYLWEGGLVAVTDFPGKRIVPKHKGYIHLLSQVFAQLLTSYGFRKSYSNRNVPVTMYTDLSFASHRFGGVDRPYLTESDI